MINELMPAAEEREFSMCVLTTVWCRAVRWWLVCCLCVLCCVGAQRSAEATVSTVFGGSLLEEGEVALTFAVGFPDGFFQFDFANSRSFNFALRGRFNYNFGFPFFGGYPVISAPMRIAIIKPAASQFKRGKAAPDPDASPLTMSIQLDPGFGLGFSSAHSTMLGFSLGVALMLSYRVLPKLHVNFGFDIPLFFSLEPGNVRNVPFGVNLPLEAVGGVEYEVNENATLFARLSVGPIVYIGGMAGNFTAGDVAVSGIARLWLGLIWRR